MKDRYKVSPAYNYDGKQNVLVGYVVVDNLTGKSVEFQSEQGFIFSMFNLEHEAQEKCQQLNTEERQKRKSEQIMKVAGVGGHGVNLCNEFNFSDLWEVIRWVVPHFEQSENEHYQTLIGGFRTWYKRTNLIDMEQHEMQTAIVDKIHELMTEAGLIV